MRMGEPELPALLVSHHRPGFYMRVITEGRLSQAGGCLMDYRIEVGTGLTDAAPGSARGG